MDQIGKSYQILGLSSDASLNSAKKAYRELVKKWHPDRFQDDPAKRVEAEEKIKEINLAFERIQEYREKYPFLSKIQATKRSKPKAKPTASKPKPRPPAAFAGSRSEEGEPKPDDAANPEPVVSPSPAGPRFRGRNLVAMAALAVALIVVLAARLFLREPPAPQISNTPAARPAAPVPPLSSEQFSLPAAPGASTPAATSAGDSTELQLAKMLATPSSPIPKAITRPAEPLVTSIPSSSPARDSSLEGGLSVPFVKELLNKKRSEEIAPTNSVIDTRQVAEENFQTGLRHANADGTSQDYAEAAKWYRLAADAGHSEAQKHLGFLYATGKGVERNQAEAEKWLGKAAGQGSVGANFAGALLALSKTNSIKNASSQTSSSRPEIDQTKRVESTRTVPKATAQVERVETKSTNLPPAAAPRPQLKRRSDLLPTNSVPSP